MTETSNHCNDPTDLLRRIQLSIDGFARCESVSTWVNNGLLKEAKAEIERLRADIQELTCGDPRKVCPNCRDKAAFPANNPDLELAWQTFLLNQDPDHRATVKGAFVAAWHAGRASHETTAKPYKPGFTQACSSFSDDPDAPSCCCYCGQPREAHPPQSSECPKCDAVRKLGLTSCFEHKQAEKASEPDDWCCEHGYREHKRGSPACERATQKASEERT